MNQAIAKLRKSPRRVLGAVICGVGIVLLVASIAGGLGGAPPGTPQTRMAATGPSDVPPEDQTAAQNPSNKQETQDTRQETSKPAPKTQTNTPQTQSANNQNPPASDPDTLTVSLKINNQTAGSVSVPPGSNQCDVLAKALEQGVIQSLNMRWDADKQTYGVYQINDVGNPEKVTWVYEVNDTSPFKGCSHIAANANDIIHWKHLN